MSDPVSMDRVGIDGLDGLAGKGRGQKGRWGSKESQPQSSSSNTTGRRIKSSEQRSQEHSDHIQTSDEFNSYTKGRLFQLREGDAKASSTSQLKDDKIALLREQGFSTGLALALNTNAKFFDRRIWIVDNSGSMEIGDGHRIVTTADRKMVAQSVTRWEELRDTVVYHSEMAALLDSPTLFKLLNHPGPGFNQQDFSVAMGGSNTEEDIRNARTFMQRLKPIGTTPLTKHIWSIQKSVHKIAPKLRREGRRVVVVLATDGLPTDVDGYIGDDVDAEFLSALQALEGLPIWLVIRLCTDEVKVTKFYNELDGQLDLNLEVLDDFLGEAEEVNHHNEWLNYCLPLHRCRELGYHNRVFDFLDERPLTKGELRDFCAVLFGTRIENVPEPNIDWKAFLRYVQDKLEFEDEQWDPLRKKKAPWISLKALRKVYGKGGKCNIM